ncbi:MAG: Lrp/AsnC family transcriptional regulator [Cyclobacteriaceae bacterium]|nr:Lrp/AsnC family transcriptional regulator [Cyclobacteriaceae bacterium]
MDSTDKKILMMLQDDSSLTHKQIAAKINMSITPVYERIKRMEKEGVILKYVALVNPEKVDKTLVAYINVSLKEHATAYLKKFELEIKQFEEVQECYHIAGVFDYLLKIVVKDMKEYQSVIIDKLASMDNIVNVQSSFVLTEVNRTTALPL